MVSQRMLFVRAYPCETQVFDAHDRAFAFFKGKAAVETVFVGKGRLYKLSGPRSTL